AGMPLSIYFLSFAHQSCRTAFSIVDTEGRAFAAFPGRPCDSSWDDVVAGATSVMEEVREQATASGAIGEDDLHHRRGNFAAFATGVSYGGGQTVCNNIMNCLRLLSDWNIRRIAGFQNSTFASFAPKLYKYYATTLQALFNHHPNLEHNFTNSVFPACTFNCGPRTSTCRHVDCGNLCCGLCALTALGAYDATRGGHLILYSLNLIIEFPPGSTALIPSGAVEHGNTPVGPNETRLSFTQYAAGGLFRWVAYHF
ncbi:hypothetical protein FPV67DRAFT_1394238, partial [Lyophyllum atratum]